VVDGQTVALAQVRHDARRDRLLADAEVHLAARRMSQRPLEPDIAQHVRDGCLRFARASERPCDHA